MLQGSEDAGAELELSTGGQGDAVVKVLLYYKCDSLATYQIRGETTNCS